MPLPRRSVPAPVQAAAAARVQGLLAPRSGWTLPPAPERLAARGPHDVLPGHQASAANAGPTTATGRRPSGDRPPGDREDEHLVADPAPAPAPGAVDADVVPARHAAPTVLASLREGRLDPGRRAAAGLAAVGLLACLLAGALVLRSAPQEVPLPAVETAGAPVEGASLPSASAAPPAGEVVVAVAGKVRRPGLVRLPVGSRVDDALRAAGGLQPGAAVGLLNLARKVVDGEQVLVGVEAPAGTAAVTGGGASAGERVVDLNAATAADLDGLPGIGPVLAERIVDHRTRNGPFRSVDQLREVSGIGEAKYSTLKDLVRV